MYICMRGGLNNNKKNNNIINKKQQQQKNKLKFVTETVTITTLHQLQ